VLFFVASELGLGVSCVGRILGSSRVEFGPLEYFKSIYLFLELLKPV
jgi:hypothetical protein